MIPVTELQPRIATLDIVRGVAVMGILAMNITGYAMPEGAYFNPTAYGGATGEDFIAWTAAFILFDGKMRGLFSLLFGASMLLVIITAEKKGKSPASIHYRRIFWLFLFGAAHFYLIWWGDILLHYALIALAAYLFHGFGVRALAMAAAIFVTIDFLVLGSTSLGFLHASAEAALPSADPSAVRNWTAMSVGFAPLSPAELEANLALHRGGFAALFEHRIAKELWAPFAFILVGGFETLALMLIGMIGLRTGFLTGEWPVARYRRVALWCIPIGTIGFAFLAAIIIRSGFDTATIFAAAFGAAAPFRFIMVVGYAALIILLTRNGGWLVERIAAAGRAAFTNYLGTSLIMTFTFYGWGLGLFGRFDRAEVYLFVLAMWALMLLWSKPWLDRFQYGPFEWLWRSLARGSPQPMRRAVPTAI